MFEGLRGNPSLTRQSLGFTRRKTCGFRIDPVENMPQLTWMLLIWHAGSKQEFWICTVKNGRPGAWECWLRPMSRRLQSPAPGATNLMSIAEVVWLAFFSTINLRLLIPRDEVILEILFFFRAPVSATVQRLTWIFTIVGAGNSGTVRFMVSSCSSAAPVSAWIAKTMRKLRKALITKSQRGADPMMDDPCKPDRPLTMKRINRTNHSMIASWFYLMSLGYKRLGYKKQRSWTNTLNDSRKDIHCPKCASKWLFAVASLQG